MASLQLLPITGSGGPGLSHLLYCVFLGRDEGELDELTGVDGQPISVLAHNGLSAVISLLAVRQLPPVDVTTILSYQRVINHFHHRRTIIPMRYGCIVAGEAQVSRLLEDRFDEYRELLEALDGCDEMGIRVLLDHPVCGEPAPGLRSSSSGLSVPHPVETGKGYLLARRSHYADRDQLVNAEKAIFDTVCEPFSGLFVRCKVEKSTPVSGDQRSSCRLLSLYFLVNRAKVEEFRQVFQAFASRYATKILLSGPWPPFNFVVPDTP
jgi:hypothetical protein